jgi:hypothetical protein
MITITNGPKNTLKSLLSLLHFKTLKPKIANKFFIVFLSQKLKNMKNTLKKTIILTCHADFAFISTDFVHWGCNFICSTTMYDIISYFIDQPLKMLNKNAFFALK